MSSGSGDLEKAKKYFQESIDSMKCQIEECILHHKFLPTELVNKLNNAYQGNTKLLDRSIVDINEPDYHSHMFHESQHHLSADLSSLLNIIIERIY